MAGICNISILGGGPAGLSAAYYAGKCHLSFTLYEGTSATGGNCRTLRYKDFLYDTGAHRFHDQDKAVTDEVRKIMGDSLKRIRVPSKIFYKGRFLDFPLSPLNLIKNTGPATCLSIAWEVIRLKVAPPAEATNFEEYALQTYGKTIADSFLLNYSEKLWGTTCRNLSLHTTGKRLKGLDFKTFLREALRGSNNKTTHLDGAFYYPDKGIGQIFENISEVIGKENIHTNAKITKILCEEDRIKAIEINNDTTTETDEIISTLPLPLLLNMMDPSPPADILDLASRLKFRHLKLVCFFINKASVTSNATLYFPEREYPFTRAYEPKNRSHFMAPQGKTSLIVEVPYQQDDLHESMNDKELIGLVREQLIKINLIKREDVTDTLVHRISNAYPVMEKGIENTIERLEEYLKKFRNLKLSGRNSKFEYTSIHHMLASGKEIIEAY